MSTFPRSCVLLAAALGVVACGPRLRLCGDDVSDCGEGAYCDEAHGVCVLLLEDGGRWVDPALDAGATSAPAVDGGFDAGVGICNPGETRPCALGCGSVQRCGANGFWELCQVNVCATGLECVAGQCTCTARVCAGCCANQFTCRPGDSPTACGYGGAACANCGSNTCKTNAWGPNFYACRP